MKTFERFRNRKKGKAEKVNIKTDEPIVDVPTESIDFDLIETFLKLTEYTTPYGWETDLEHILPKGVEEDAMGNYFIKIGNSTSLFTCHLDNACKNKVKIEHVINGKFIATDGKSILGSDNKAGVIILMYMISKNVPGTYYFFVGEECGRVGSEGALKLDPNYFKEFKRCIAFDRKAYGSIITHQMCQRTCSAEFAEKLIEELGKSGMKYVKDDGGSYTDSYTFAEDISECTNISNGTFAEHSVNEKLDTDYLTKLCKAVVKVDWESLPAKRDFTTKEYDYGDVYSGYGIGGVSTYGGYGNNPNQIWYPDRKKTKKEEDDEHESSYQRLLKAFDATDDDDDDSMGTSKTYGYKTSYKVNLGEFYAILKNYLVIRYFDEEYDMFNEKMLYYFSKQEMDAISQYAGVTLKEIDREMHRIPYLNRRFDSGGNKYIFDPKMWKE